MKADKVKQQKIIDDIFSEADPNFVKEMAAIDPAVLNGKDIQKLPESVNDYDASFIGRHWHNKSVSFKITFLSLGFIFGFAIPLLTVAYMGWLTPEYKEDKGFSIKDISSESLLTSPGEGQDNLFKIFPVSTYYVEIPEKIYLFKAGEKIRYGRFSFYVELFTLQDAEAYANRIDEVTEAFVKIIRKTNATQWKGTQGKEKIRAELLSEINASMKSRAKIVRFKSIYI